MGHHCQISYVSPLWKGTNKTYRKAAWHPCCVESMLKHSQWRGIDMVPNFGKESLWDQCCIDIVPNFEKEGLRKKNLWDQCCIDSAFKISMLFWFYHEELLEGWLQVIFSASQLCSFSFRCKEVARKFMRSYVLLVSQENSIVYACGKCFWIGDNGIGA